VYNIILEHTWGRGDHESHKGFTVPLCHPIEGLQEMTFIPIRMEFLIVHTIFWQVFNDFSRCL
jgi:hypothetical protein